MMSGEKLLWHGISGARYSASGGDGKDHEPGAQLTVHVDGLGREDASGGVRYGDETALFGKN